MNPEQPLSRRTFIRTAGGLIIGFSLSDSLAVAAAAQNPAAPAGPRPIGPPLARLDSWLRIERDGTVRVLTGKVEIGMGVDVALKQIVAEELDVPVDRVLMQMGDTAVTPDQGGVGASNAISSGGRALRNVAATARGALLQLASRRLAAPVAELEVRDGVVRSTANPAAAVSYGELVAANALNQELKVTGSGFSLQVEGSGTPKDPASYSIVGKPIPRTDLTEKVFGSFKYVGDVRVPGMLHGRVIRPAGVGARFVSMNDDGARAIAGFVKTVVKGDFVGVVAETEWAAVKAAGAVKVTWSAPAQAFPPQDDLYAYLRTTKPKASRETLKRGDAASAAQRATKKIEAVYEYPFHSHATMGPGCAVADVQTNDVTTVWCGAQKPHASQRGFAELLGVEPDRVRVVWVQDSGSYGRPGFDDVAADALLLSQAVGKPVRVQWMRDHLTQWGPKGPAGVFEVSAGLDAQGNVSGLQFASRVFSGGEIHFIPTNRGNFLGAQLSGIPNTSGFDEFANWGNESPAYTIPDIVASAHVVPSFYAGPSPLAGTHLRDPNGPATSFAVESFMDELAAAAGIDPIEFRLKYLDQPRAKAVLTAAAEKYGWQARASSAQLSSRDRVVRGRGAALGIRGGTLVGNVAEVEVNRQSGAVRVTRFVVAHDCGLVINPMGLVATIQANIVQTLSRTLVEEVRFSRTSVTSVDWATYPIARMSDVPPIDVVLVNHPELPATGAGEPATRAVAAAVANAIFDATGVRLRRVPFTAERVRAALA